MPSHRQLKSTKICTQCKMDKPREDFHLRNKNSLYIYHMCKDCFRIRQKYRRSSNRDFINELKSILKCNRCEESHISCLQFHHKDAFEKDFGIAQMKSMALSKKRILKEIEKCEVLCANCHAKHHWKVEH